MDQKNAVEDVTKMASRHVKTIEKHRYVQRESAYETMSGPEGPKVKERGKLEGNPMLEMP
jgi:hypothetical protein